jgi:predicted RNA binding protein YcfA (HicA-like mRNA interferase family)
MKSLSGKELARLLEERGWELRRVHGSHHIYAKHESSLVSPYPSTETVPSKGAFSSTC